MKVDDDIASVDNLRKGNVYGDIGSRCGSTAGSEIDDIRVPWHDPATTFIAIAVAGISDSRSGKYDDQQHDG